jgi:DNA-binding response OmpR family regulator
MSSGRFSALVVHGDGEALDVLTRWFEASGFEVITAPSVYRAQAYLEGERPVEVVVAPWDVSRSVGGDIYRWVLQHRPDLRTRFVFIATDVPPEFDALVGGRCLAIPPSDLDEIVRVSTAVVRRVRTPPRGVPVVRGPNRPPLLLADDDPLLLGVMAEVLTQAGYAVNQVDSLKSAIELTEFRDFDAIVVDWHMHDGGGGDLYRWVVGHKPHLAQRIVFLGEADQDDPGQVAPGRPIFRKGQDSQGLIDMLREIVAQVRGLGG